MAKRAKIKGDKIMIYCANCFLCKWFKDEYGFLRVKCIADQWLTPSGQPKTYSLHTVHRRMMGFCEYYDSMGDPGEYIKDLKVELPTTKGDCKVVEAVVESGAAT